MVERIFISYRRDDSAGHAGRVFDRLRAEFGQDVLFMDVDAIPLGSNFVKVLRDEVARCSVFLAIIGPRWLDALDEDGARRLDNPDDFVRVEIAAALARDIPVIPILLEGAKVPRASALPADLRELSQRNGLDVRHASFHPDVDKLVRGLKVRGIDLARPPAAVNSPATLPPMSEPAKAPTLPDGTIGIGGTTYVAIADRRLFTEAPTIGRSSQSVADSPTKLGDYVGHRKQSLSTVDEVIAEVGLWHMALGAKGHFSEPSLFDNLFIYVGAPLPGTSPGSIVKGKTWYGTTVPDWQIVHGQASSADDTVSIPVGYLTYLGPEWRSEYIELSDAVFKKLGGQPMARFIKHS